MQDALLACIGWMVDARDHSVHEIQMAAKSFGLEYTPGPCSYQFIRPNDEAFHAKLRDAQTARGHLMPDEVLSESHVIETAQALFADFHVKRMQFIKASLHHIESASVETKADDLIKTQH